MSGFPWKAHTAASVLTCKHLNATLRQCERLRACLYRVCVSQDGFVGLRGVRSDCVFFFFSFSLPLTSIPELGERVVTAPDGQGVRWSPAGSLVPRPVIKRSRWTLVFICGAPRWSYGLLTAQWSVNDRKKRGGRTLSCLKGFKPRWREMGKSARWIWLFLELRKEL